VGILDSFNVEYLTEMIVLYKKGMDNTFLLNFMPQIPVLIKLILYRWASYIFKVLIRLSLNLHSRSSLIKFLGSLRYKVPNLAIFAVDAMEVNRINSYG
jgi:hypothetical protein